MSVWSVLQSVVFLFLGIVVNRLYSRWADEQQDHELWIDCLSESMKKPMIDPSLSPLEYSVAGSVIHDPYEVELCIWASGKNDIGPDRFLSALVVRLGVPVVTELAESEGVNSSEANFSVDPVGKIVIAPSVIRRNMAVRWRFVTEGEPSLDWNNPFLDTEIQSLFAEWEKPRASRSAMTVMGICALIASVLWIVGGIALVTAGVVPSPFIIVAMLGFSATFFIGVLLFAQSDGPGRRLRRSNRALQGRIVGALDWHRLEDTGDPMRDTRYPRGRRVRSSGHPRPQDTR